MSTADVFIIESLSPDDEGNGRFEGSSIAHLLRLHGKKPEYRYVRTKQELYSAIKDFSKSNYRYLHISSHGNEEGIFTTNLDEINFVELGAKLQGCMDKKRLFMSACLVTSFKSAVIPIKFGGALSVVGPRGDIAFDDAVVMWNLIYHLVFKNGDRRITRPILKSAIENVSKILEVDIAYYAGSESKKVGIKKVL